MMKLRTFLFLAVVLFSCIKSFSQSQGKVTIAGKGLRLDQVFRIIEEKAGYEFVYDRALLEKTHPVTLDLKEVPLKEALDICLKDQGLNYTIKNNIVVITRKEGGHAFNGSEPQTASVADDPPLELIEGSITDEKGVFLPGATIFVRTSGHDHRFGLGQLSPGEGNRITITDKEGHFSLHGSGKDSLVVSSVGYKTRTIAIKDRKVVNVVLYLFVTDMEEVVVDKGYYKISQRLNTGDVTTVSAEQLERQPVTNVLQALEGQVPGLYISQNNGVPGSNSTVQLRGVSSLLSGTSTFAGTTASYLGNDPLYIVDGIPFSPGTLAQISNTLGGTQPGSAAGYNGLSPFNSLNMQDIESVTVLKDADATAIYGSRGANGVIIITTKKGKSGPSKVNASVYTGINTLSRVQPYLNTPQYLAMRREAFANDGKTPGMTDYDVNGVWDTTRNTNWAKQLIMRPSQTTNAQLSVSGGNEQTQYLIAGGYNVVTPPYDGHFSDKRPSLHVSINNTSPNKKFKLGLSANYSVDNNTEPGFDAANNINMAPDVPSLLNPNGTIDWTTTTQNLGGNPYITLKQPYSATTKLLLSNAQLSYQVLPGLQIRSSLGYSSQTLSEYRLTPSTTVSPGATTANLASFGTNGVDSWIIEPQAEFKHKLYKGQLSVMAGATVQENVSNGQTVYASNFSNDAFLRDPGAAATVNVSASNVKYRYDALFGRIGYNLMDRYLLNLTGRRDGSSRFGPGRQFGNFGAIGAGWIFSEEGFVRNNLHFLSFGKLRGSYGTTGSDAIGDYNYLNSYQSQPNTYLGVGEVLPSRLYNPDFNWEVDTKQEEAIELGFLKDRIMFTASHYRNRTSNQLVNVPLAPTAGAISVEANLGATIQNTGWEFQLTTTNIRTRNFTWKSILNVSTNSNKLVSFPGLAQSSYANIYVVGKPVAIKKSYRLKGVDPTTGIYDFLEADGKTLTNNPGINDRTAIVNLNPSYFGGFSNTLTYKRFQLDILMHFVKQLAVNVMYGTPGLGNGAAPGNGMNNLPTFYNGNVWEKPGDQKTIQRYTAGYNQTVQFAYNDAQVSDKYYTDGAFIRLQNLALSYTLDPQWLKVLRVSGTRVYFMAQNLLTITRFKGSDPETQGSVLPPLKTWTCGIQTNL